MYNKKKYTSLIAFLAVSIMLFGAFIPIGQAVDIDRIEPFEKGPSYKGVVPLKKTTLVQFDKNKILDDYAYLAAVPTTVFNEGDELYSHPLLFFEEEYKYKKEIERTLNAYQGLDYFMQDWAEFCNNNFDQVTLINVDKKDVEQWGNSREYKEITGDDPFDIANQIALNEWSYSDEAVIAVIEEDYEKPNEITSGKISGAIPKYNVENREFKIEKPSIGIGGTYKSFDILDENFKYIIAKMNWKEKEDYDMQLYDDQLGMVQVAMESYGADYPYTEIVASFIHNYGKWEISISAVPKKETVDTSGVFESMYYDSMSDSSKSTGIFNTNVLDVKVGLYPGAEAKIPATPFGCRKVKLTLSWEASNVDLGFTVLDPIGNEIACSVSDDELLNEQIKSSKNNEIEIELDRLGECQEGENYSVCVFALDDLNHEIDFDLEYEWEQNFSKLESDCFESASNGAVLSSSLNAPLLYTKPSSMSSETKDVLLKLGVENLYIVNIGNHLDSGVIKDIKEVGEIKGNFKEALAVYDKIRQITEQNDVIFTTIDPWDYWHVNGRKPEGTYPGALHVGPAAYIAAHHGSPVIIVDNHPLLSQAVVYPTDFWRKNAVNRGFEPSAGSMLLSGKRAYEFIEKYGFGKIEEGLSDNQDHEIIITVAGQFDIGTPWDRSFTGAGIPGRFWGSPVDSSYVISRNIFYPAMIFVNPGMEKVELWQGSASKTGGLLSRLKEPKGVNLVITRPLQQKEFSYPVLQTYTTYQYRFNELASKQWDFKYTRADGITPYEEPSPDIIDDGAAITKSGTYYPDQSESEVIPFYADKAGYDSVFSTNFEYIVKNLNEGCLIWVLNAHGGYALGGLVELWDPHSPYVHEENPWRAYEPVMFKPGHLRSYVHWIPHYFYERAAMGGMDLSILEKIAQLRIFKFQFFPEVGSTENPDVALINTQLIYLNKFWKPIKNMIDWHDLWGATGVSIHRDRILRPIKSLSEGLPLINWYDGDGKVTISRLSGAGITQTKAFGIDFDNELENLHSCGINTVSCTPANTYMHLTWMRHGTTYQVIDPWTTTDWSASWQQQMLKRFALGDTIGEAYERGMRACGPELLVGQWWWDIWENVELFGDPNLRVYVPETEYSDENSWDEPELLSYDDELNINGHMPFGAKSYPHQKEAKTFITGNIWLILIFTLILVLIIAIVVINKKGSKK